MKIILQQRVAQLGRVGDIVSVARGYARNYLIPYGMALVATKDNVALLESKRSEIEAKEAAVLAEAVKRSELFKDKTIVIEMRCSEEGRLYGSVGPADIVAEFEKQGVALEKKEVIMSGPIRDLGQHEVKLQLHIDCVIPFEITVKSDVVEVPAEDSEAASSLEVDLATAVDPYADLLADADQD